MWVGLQSRCLPHACHFAGGGLVLHPCMVFFLRIAPLRFIFLSRSVATVRKMAPQTVQFLIRLNRDEDSHGRALWVEESFFECAPRHGLIEFSRSIPIGVDDQ